MEASSTTQPLFVVCLEQFCWRKNCCSVAKSCLTLCRPLDHSTLGSPVLHYLSELAQIHVHVSIRVFFNESALHIRWWWKSFQILLFSSHLFPCVWSYLVHRFDLETHLLFPGAPAWVLQSMPFLFALLAFLPWCSIFSPILSNLSLVLLLGVVSSSTLSSIPLIFFF